VVALAVIWFGSGGITQDAPTSDGGNPRLDIGDAERELVEAIDHIFEKSVMRSLLLVDCSLGKTQRLLEAAARLAAAGSKIVFAVATVALVRQIVVDLIAAGADAGLKLGMQQDDMAYNVGSKMCLELAKVQAIADAGGLETAACGGFRGSGKNRIDLRCQFKPGPDGTTRSGRVCGWQAQKLARHDITVCALNYLQFAPWPGLEDEDVRVIIDEAAWTRKTASYSVDPTELQTVAVDDDPKSIEDQKSLEWIGVDWRLLEIAHPAVDDLPDLGPKMFEMSDNDRKAFKRARKRYFAIEDLRRIARREQARFKSHMEKAFDPDLSTDELVQKLKPVGRRLRGHKHRAVAYGLLADKLKGRGKGRLVYRENKSDQGAAFVVDLAVRLDIHDEWLEGPICYADADAQQEIAEQWLGRFGYIARIRVKLPDTVTIKQVSGSWFPKSGIAPSERLPKKNLTTAWNNVHKLRRVLQALCRRSLSVGFISYKDTEQAVLADGSLPDVITGHFQNIRGSNAFADVDVLVVVGRPTPSVASIEQLTRQIFGDVVSLGARAKWPERPGIAESGIHAEPFHPDPRADAVLRGILAEVSQAVHRGRPLRNPGLTIYVVCDTPLDIRVDERITKADFWALGGPVMAMLTSGVVPHAHGDRVKMLPDMLKDEQASRNYFRRYPSEKRRIEAAMANGWPRFQVKRRGSRKRTVMTIDAACVFSAWEKLELAGFDDLEGVRAAPVG
jgi:hypothetical protein